MERVAIISTVKCPLNQLKKNVSYHLNVGIDEIILFCDDPLDKALETYALHPKISVIPCTDDYWRQRTGRRPDSLPERQIFNVNEGAKIAQEKDCTWITHIDCDELIDPLRDIHQVLADSQADVIRYSLFEAVPEHDEYAHVFMPTLFRKPPSQWQTWTAKALGCSSAFYCDEFFRGHKSSKVLVRLSPKIYKHGVHRPDEYATDTIFMESHELRLLHYYSTSYSGWKEKYEAHYMESLEGYDPEEWFSPSRKKQFHEYVLARDKGEAECSLLYKKIYMVSNPMRRILVLLGMLQTLVPNEKHWVSMDD